MTMRPLKQQNFIVRALPVEVTWKSIRHMYLRVYPPRGDVRISAPQHTNIPTIEAFVMQKYEKIQAMRQHVSATPQHPEYAYRDEETHFLWGKPYTLYVFERGREKKIEIHSLAMIMVAPEESDRATLETIMREWYRRALKEAMPAVIKRCEAHCGVRADEYRIKNMKTRWGSCNPRARRIWINLQLAKKPVECLEYILTHELVHLYEPNHSPRFYALMDRYYPDWRDVRDILDRPLIAPPPEEDPNDPQRFHIPHDLPTCAT